MTGQQIITRSLKRYMPDFCYLTAYEVLTFLEQLDEDVDEDSVVVVLCWLVRAGRVFSRPIVTPERTHRLQRSPRVEYIRNPEWNVHNDKTLP